MVQELVDLLHCLRVDLSPVDEGRRVHPRVGQRLALPRREHQRRRDQHSDGTTQDERSKHNRHPHGRLLLRQAVAGVRIHKLIVRQIRPFELLDHVADRRLHLQPLIAVHAVRFSRPQDVPGVRIRLYAFSGAALRSRSAGFRHDRPGLRAPAR